MSSIDTYTHSIISGLLKLITRSALLKSLKMRWEMRSNLLGLVGFAGVGLDHADALQVLVDHVVELVVGVEHALEHRVHAAPPGRTEPKASTGMQARNTKEMDGLMRNEKIHATIIMIGARTPMTNDHGIGVLQVGHIGGEPA